MYLDGKFHLRKDLSELNRARIVTKMYTEALANNRLSLYNFFDDVVQRIPNHEAIWSREGTFTFSQFSFRANQYAHWFLSQGVKPGQYVAFYLTNSPDFVFAWMGLWAIAAAPAMINYNLAGKALLHCLTTSGADLLLVDDDEELSGRIEEVRGGIEGELGMKIVVRDEAVLGQIKGYSGARIDDAYREGVKPNTPMAMFYTSGTTGMPKGVPFNTDRQWLSAAAYKAGYTNIQKDDRWYNCMPMYHGTGGVTAMSMVLNGVTLCVGKKFSTSRFWKDIHDAKATWFIYVGETARYLLAAPPSPLDKGHNLRCMYGNGLRPDVWVKFRERFDVPEVAEFFSSSEGVFGLINHARGDYLAASVGHHGAIGRLFYKNMMVPVEVDEVSGAISRDHKTGFAIRNTYEKGGEIIVQIPEASAFAGYYKNPEATAKKFERDVFKKGDIWYRTGDALRRTSDGRWFFLDRLGDTFRWKGENVSTAEVSEVLGHFPGVVEANVYGVQLPNHDGRAGCAALYIDPKDRSIFDFAGLLKHSRTELPKYAVPLFLRIVGEMTPIHNNKQNKVPLREEGVNYEKVKGEDRLLWVDEKGSGSTYVDFSRENWESLKLGKARL
ncbi:hypothetical protein BJ875DRAFT_400538 [Amylocarpus encephaloides]|uniref:Very long-chain fatty acid transport protein n=1 Tax=Amylocarpus encephaloides TaxID=45428 RepID=A0A9P7YJG9_9HELO|nr:hypothetical protein BJ875DRAFT_400538 [Amylocarpus encephaloides]